MYSQLTACAIYEHIHSLQVSLKNNVDQVSSFAVFYLLIFLTTDKKCNDSLFAHSGIFIFRYISYRDVLQP